MKTEAETTVKPQEALMPRIAGHHQKLGRGIEGLSPRAFGRSMGGPSQTLILDFCPPELLETQPLLL